MLALALLTLAALGGNDAVVDAPPNTERLAVLAEYHVRRDQAKAGVKDQFALAEWCEQHGLRDEAAAHYTVVTRLEPKLEAAWTKLGYRKYEGSWRRDDQIARIQNDRRDREQADARYRPWLTAWRDWLKAGGDMKKAVNSARDRERSPRSFVDPSGLLAAKIGLSTLAVLMLSDIDANEATVELCMLAVDGTSPVTRKAAGKALDKRDPRVFVGYLINRIREPVHFEVRSGTDGNSAGELWVEERDVIVDHVYDLPADASLPKRHTETVFKRDSSGISRRFSREVLPDLAATDRSAVDGVHFVEKQLARDVRLKELENFAINRSNERVLPLLRHVTGQQMGPSREVWANWWIDQLGYTYQSRPVNPERKPVIVSHVQAAVPPPATFVVFDTPVGLTHHSCFAIGTSVRTETGSRPIEARAWGSGVCATPGRVP